MRQALGSLSATFSGSTFGAVAGGLEQTVDLARQATRQFGNMQTAGISAAAAIGSGLAGAASDGRGSRTRPIKRSTRS